MTLTKDFSLLAARVLLGVKSARYMSQLIAVTAR